MFLVIRSGVYRHEVLDVRATRYEAILRAEALLQAEKDDYHEMEVVEVREGEGEVGGCFVRWKRDGKYPYTKTSSHEIIVTGWSDY